MEKQTAIANFKKRMLLNLWNKVNLLKAGIINECRKIDFLNDLILFYCSEIICQDSNSKFQDFSDLKISYVKNTLSSTYDVEVTNYTNASYLFTVNNSDYTITQVNNKITLSYVGIEKYCSQELIVNCVVNIEDKCIKTVSITIPKTCKTEEECNTLLLSNMDLIIRHQPTTNSYEAEFYIITGSTYVYSTPTENWTTTQYGNRARFNYTGPGNYCEHELEVQLILTNNECSITKTQIVPVSC